ncbi:MAG: preprotein translocase subunit SecY [Candidatus Campbellbacteria bacterium]|nr:preprotein translocase subunit SecY [Candidatus Campbellbacteria bacterium]
MTIIQTLSAIATDKILVRRIGFILFGLICFRLLASIPVPGVDTNVLSALLEQNQFLGIFNIFSGGGLENFSIALLGVFPYITVAIVAQLLTSVIPRLHELYHEEGEIGRKKMGQYIRVASVPIAAANAFGLLTYFQTTGVLPELDWFVMLVNVSVMTAGAVLLMWVGELMTEFGIGNGISMIVFAGIVVNIPTLIGQAVFAFETADIPLYVGIILGIFVLFYIVVLVNEAARPVPVTYARFERSGTTQASRTSTYLPLKVNPVGVLPSIFALTIVAFVRFLSGTLSNSSNEIVSTAAQATHTFLANNYYFAIPVFILVIFFTYFYTPIVLNTKKMSENLQKQGAFVPGIRPGGETKEYMDTIIIRILGVGALFLGVVTASPFLIQGGVTQTALFAIGGTSVLITVSVILDIHRKIQAHLVTFNKNDV